MNKQNLVDAVGTSSGDSKTAIGRAINAVLNVITRAATASDVVQLAGLGSFSMGQLAARTGRNPSTGAEIRITAAKTVKFAAGKAFKDAVNVS